MASRAEHADLIRDLINDRSGLWLITDARKDLFRQYVGILSPQLNAVVREIIDMASHAETFWTTKAEYYHVLMDIRRLLKKIDRGQIERVIQSMVIGSAMANVNNQPWVQSALSLLRQLAEQS